MGVHRFAHRMQAITYVHRFVALMQIRPLAQTEAGVTWMEFFIAMELHGGKLEPPVRHRLREDMAKPALTVRQSLVEFNAMLRFIVETCVRPLDALFFKTSTENGTRLRTIAVQHSMPSLNFMPVWCPHVAHLITEALLRQKGKMTQAMVRAHKAGCLELRWSNMCTKGVPAWRACLEHGPRTILQQSIDAETSTDISSYEGVVDDDELLHTFACPKCSCTRSILKCSLLVKSGWGHILCKICRATSRSKTWTCVCGRLWHNCPVHAHVVRQAT